MSIIFRCRRCDQSLTTEDNMAGQTVACPTCQQPLRVPQVSHSQSTNWQGRAFPFIASAAGASLLWAIIATFVANSHSTSLRRTRYELNQVRSNIDKFEKEAQTARNEAERIRREAEGFTLLQEENMNKMYPGLRKYTPGRNEISHSYLEAFEVERNRIKTFMRNRTSTSARPKFDIIFLTKYGFVTETFRKSWLLDSMAPGQSRIDDDSGIYWRFGEPVYFTINFNN